MHGYELNVELERRNVRAWAAISRAQVYYSLTKLHSSGYLEWTSEKTENADQRRRICNVTPSGKEAYTHALIESKWHETFPLHASITWAALAAQLDGTAFANQVKRRKNFLLSLIEEKESIIDRISVQNSRQEEMARASVRFMIATCKAELAWIEEISAAKRNQAGERGTGAGNPCMLCRRPSPCRSRRPRVGIKARCRKTTAGR
jgi:DNA-binding PadR family transcriptional regulator